MPRFTRDFLARALTAGHDDDVEGPVGERQSQPVAAHVGTGLRSAGLGDHLGRQIDAGEIGRNFETEAALVGDVRATLRALLASRLHYVRATDIAASIGKGLALVLGFGGIFGLPLLGSNPMLLLIAWFVWSGATREALMVRRRSPRLFSDRPVPRELIESAVRTAALAPSGAHKQPWTFCAVSKLRAMRFGRCLGRCRSN